jgi:hypothetical protein
MGGAGVLVVVLAAVVVVPWLGGRQVSPARRSATVGSAQQSSLPKPSAAVQLQARGGESWVLVEDLQGRRVFDAILQPGGSQSLSLGSGLRLRSGRPDLLFVSIGGAAPKPLGAVSDLDWVELRP